MLILMLIAVWILGFAVGYMIGHRHGKQLVKMTLNELYGKFGHPHDYKD